MPDSASVLSLWPTLLLTTQPLSLPLRQTGAGLVRRGPAAPRRRAGSLPGVGRRKTRRGRWRGQPDQGRGLGRPGRGGAGGGRGGRRGGGRRRGDGWQRGLGAVAQRQEIPLGFRRLTIGPQVPISAAECIKRTCWPPFSWGQGGTDSWTWNGNLVVHVQR